MPFYRSSIFALLCFGISGASPALAATGIHNLRCEYTSDPIFIDQQAPRLSWTYSGDTPHEVTVQLSESLEALKNGQYLWTEKILDPSKISTVYSGAPLKSHSKYFWQVVAYGNASKTASFETSKMKGEPWTAAWITDGNDKECEPAPMFRKSFTLAGKPANARTYISAAGYYNLWINGKPVGDSYMDPGFTHYNKRNLYSTHDVTNLLRQGQNTIAVVLGNGFYNCQSKAVWDYEKASWRARPSFILELRDLDADKLIIASDTTWKTSVGPYTYNNLYSGDHYDARLFPEGWLQNGFNDNSWEKAVVANSPSKNLSSQQLPPIRCIETIKPKLLKSWGDTVYVFDMGKNIAGVSAVSLRGPAGTELKISHGELLKSSGRLEPGNIDIYYHPEKPYEKFQTDVFTLAGTGKEETFMPAFTYHGFRYVEIVLNKPLKLSANNVKGKFICTDLDKIGSFECSNPLLNKIYRATMLSYQGNMHSIPTDCPQREKNGWTADAHISTDLGLLNFDGIKFYEKYLTDFIDNQRQNGNIAGIIPSCGWGYGQWPGPVWDAALFIIPNAIYEYYGDPTIIQQLYPTMLKYMEWTKSLEDEAGLLGNGIGDWLPYKSQTPTHYTSSVYYYLHNKLMAKFATLTGNYATPYQTKAETLRDSINARWFDKENASYANGTQTALALALACGIVPQDSEEKVAASLCKKVADDGFKADFGLLGSKTVLPMLVKYGYVDEAYRLATQVEAPSWGYWIEKCGYTTLPETWTLSPEFRDASLNHVFFGHISAWMTNDLAGIKIDRSSPGFKHFFIQPHYPSGLDSAQASYESIRGLIKSQWKRKGNTIELTVTVPTTAEATVYAPKPVKVGAGTHKFKFSI